ncbi:NAD-dependent histone deacetylase sir2 [Elasticomyces elasticus]|nr:NAD-dependent histone deacetylase sir2 [Elasticomyces elasticus]KAK4976331.1 NAD-dependent histone deacetylase sir2 [Elasticomyces elasticus]
MDNVTAKPLLPSTLTPRSQLKRNHGENIDLTGSDGDEDDPSSQSNTVARQEQEERSAQRRKFGDDGSESESDEDSMLGDYVDHFEVDPYVAASDRDGLSQERSKALCIELRQIGLKPFTDKYSRSIPMRTLGTAFGIDPELGVPDEMYAGILRLAINRAYIKRLKLSQHNTIDDAARLLRRSKKTMVITGAGISTSLGIPDFRSKNSGFYDQVQALGYADGQDVFNIETFDQNPADFYSLAGAILPDLKRFSPTHAFIKLLQDKGRLQRNYTQNIDNLEALAGIKPDRLIQCHGSFATASCRKCKHKVPGHAIFEDIRAKRIARCKRCVKDLAKEATRPKPLRKKRSSLKLHKNDWDSSSGEEDDNIPEPGVMKPDITFFGEQLPGSFFDQLTDFDSKDVELVIVIGTSLKVAPVSEIPNYLPAKVPHIFISREPIEHVNFDIQLLGECDHIVYELCRRAEWNLKHEMIPRDMRVNVAPVEGSTYRWAITPAQIANEPKPQKSSKANGA